MRYLIDTNVFINIIEDYFLSEEVRAILEDYENIIYISSKYLKIDMNKVELTAPCGLDCFNCRYNLCRMKLLGVEKWAV
jgi:PIN domain nuclease of toxin-antitoxin system